MSIKRSKVLYDLNFVDDTVLVVDNEDVEKIQKCIKDNKEYENVKVYHIVPIEDKPDVEMYNIKVGDIKSITKTNVPSPLGGKNI